MPFYDYYCSDCEDKFCVMHSMSEEWDRCEICDGENITKIVASVGLKIDEKKFKKKAGDLVKSHIEEAKRDIKKEKSDMKKRMYKDD